VVERAARRAPHARFESRLDECFVYAAPDALERAIGNLVDNALKWNPPEGVVRIAVHADSREAVLSVADEGPGIPPRRSSAYLRPLLPVAGGAVETRPGLGLSIVRQIADTHAGRVVAQPNPHGIQKLLALTRVG
jgi:two-component system sensor histidine kinase MprB